MSSKKWNPIKLGDALTLKRGYDLTHTDRKPGSIPVISSSGFSGFHHIAMVKGPGVVTGRYGTLGELFFVEQDFWPHNTTLYVKDFKGNDPRFIFYLLKTLNFGDKNDKTSVPGLNRNDLHLIEINLPPLPTQRRIASILTALDDKIELNRRMNETLEGIAQALWGEWFGKYASGEVELPEGWITGTVFDIANLIGGGTPKTGIPGYWDGNIPWISAKDTTPNNRQFIIETEKNISREGLVNSSAKLLPAYSTVVSARGTVGNYCIISEEMAISQSNYAFKASIENADFYLFHQIGNMVEEMKQRSYGTVFDTITTKTFSDIEIIIPPINVVQKFERVITPIYQMRLTCNKESKLLGHIREILLPKLMKREIELL
jgi:type I restriction enzyme S subunit